MKIFNMVTVFIFILSLSSCESLKIAGIQANPLLQYKDEILCPALRVDESVYNIEEELSESKFLLSNKDKTQFELLLSVDLKKNELNLYQVILDGVEIDITLFQKSRFTELERKYCERFYNSDVSNVFSSAQGIPADELNFTIPSLEKDSRNFLFFAEPVKTGLKHVSKDNILKRNADYIDFDYKDSDLLKRVDWELVHELNMQAYEIWQGYQEEYSNEEIRMKFFDGEILEFQELKDSTKLVLESTRFQSTFNQRNISHYHPVFSQIILEILFENYILPGQLDSEEYVVKEEGVESTVEKSLIDYYIGNKSIGLDIGSTESQKKKKVNLVSNAVVLLQTFDHMNCADWGLRPELTRLYFSYRLRNGLRPGEMSSSSYSSNSQRVDFIYPTLTNYFSMHIQNSLFSACGDSQKVKVGYLANQTIYQDIISPYYILNFDEVVKQIEEKFFFRGRNYE